MCREYDDHADAETAAMPDDLLAEQVAAADAEAVDWRVLESDRAAMTDAWGDWPSSEDIEAYERAEAQKRRTA
jgi:hypothetical protein